MTLTRLCLLLAICAFATVPWALPGATSSVAGLPLWALYSILISAVLAGVTAYLLGRYWSLVAGEEAEDA